MSKRKQVAAVRHVYQTTPSFEPVYAAIIYDCTECGADLPPGKAGRRCRECREKPREADA